MCCGDVGGGETEWREISRLLEFYALSTSGRVLTCDIAHSWRLYSAARLGDQATRTHSVTLSSHLPNQLMLIMPSTWLGSSKYKYTFK